MKSRPYSQSMPECPRSDDELVASILKGDQAAFGLLYERYKDLMYGFVVKSLNDRSGHTEDLVQSVWMGVIRGLPNYQGPNTFKGWLFQIARFQIASRWRTKYNNKEDLLNEDEEENSSGIDQFASSAPTSEEELLSRTETSRVQAAIARLPDRQRTLLLQWLTEEFSYEDLAQEHGVTLQNIKTLLYRAKQSVIDALRDDS